MLVPKFWESWSWLVASSAVVLPELLQVIEPEWKSAIRLVALVLVVILRPIPQKRLDSTR